MFVVVVVVVVVVLDESPLSLRHVIKIHVERFFKCLYMFKEKYR